ncbi:homocitrate synthase [Candidatus Woesearchaeota archaeon]|nr:homocitrate synthase [Candidatus Woesearchaeota archaeon]|tara:strand:- start:4904 stop:6283 length:1380 start_codon:yes stop_codon:yes gene_type:complete
MLKVLDTTLREGEQAPQVNFTVDEKIKIAKLLDKVGVDMIEAGDPSVSPKVFEAIKRISSLNLNAEIIAHSLATKLGIDKAKEAGVDRVAILFPTSKIHLQDKVKKTEDEAIKIIEEHVSYAKGLGLKVRFTPEDATRTEPDFLIKACNTAIKAGADRVCFADTIGIMQPHIFYERARELKEKLSGCEIDVHCHNDLGLALANTMAGIRAGASCVHVTVNGMGERAGIPDLAETIMAFKILENSNKYDIKRLTEISSYVEKVSGFFNSPNKTIVGENAFSHKCGVHTNGILKNPNTYELFSPEIIGRERKIIVDKYTGKAAVASKLKEYGINADDEQLKRIVEEIKKIGDERKILHTADIIDIAEQVTGVRSNIIPKKVNALVLIEAKSQVYTSSIIRKLRNFKSVSRLFEITGDYDISAHIEVNNTTELNNLIEELRALPGVKQTNTKLVLKMYENSN